MNLGFIHSKRAPLLGALFCILVTATRAATLVPIEDFFGDRAIGALRVAPDGKHLAYLAPYQGHTSVGLLDLVTGKASVVGRANDGNIQFLFWKGSDLIVFGSDVGGNESDVIFSLNIHTGNVVRLAESYRERYADLVAFASVLDELQLDPDHILIYGSVVVSGGADLIAGGNLRGGRVGVFKLNVKTGVRELQFERHPLFDPLYDGDLGRYVADSTGTVRIRQIRDHQVNRIQYRPDSKNSFTDLTTYPADTELAPWDPKFFGADDRTLYIVVTRPDGTDTLCAYDTETKSMGSPLFVASRGNIDGVFCSWDRRKLYGVSTTEDKTRFHWLDSDQEKLRGQIDAAFPHLNNVVTSVSADESILVIFSSSDREPGFYSMMDKRRHLIMALGKTHPKIEAASMAAMEPISFKARDGLEIPGYLTLPLLFKTGSPVPLILHPHGGPYGIRDNWGFDPEVQFLANRGYAVLQVNYRGSGGVGRALFEAGRYEWGGKMQDDLTDAVKWAIAKGYADPERVCIYGASYGGYAALAGVTFTPELYKCAVNYVGPSDLNLLTNVNNPERMGLKDYFADWIGTDPKVLAARSPVNFVENIRVPTMHAYGENDPRVDIKHWHRLKAQLDRFHKPYVFIDEADEGHGFKNEAPRINLYRQLEAFLAKNL